jgi:hypothetical protein
MKKLFSSFTWRQYVMMMGVYTVSTLAVWVFLAWFYANMIE